MAARDSEKKLYSPLNYEVNTFCIQVIVVSLAKLTPYQRGLVLNNSILKYMLGLDETNFCSLQFNV